MVRTKNAINYLLAKNKVWINCWHLPKNDYGSILQEDIIFFSYVRSIVFSYDKTLEFLYLRLYRNANMIFVNVFLIIAGKINTDFFCNFSVNINKIVRYQKKVYLFIHKFNNMICSTYIAVKIGKFLEKRIKLKSKVIKMFLDKLTYYCTGFKIQCSGRLSNVDMAKTSSISFGLMPLQSINLNIDFSFVIANTNVGLQSVKVWLLHR